MVQMLLAANRYLSWSLACNVASLNAILIALRENLTGAAWVHHYWAACYARQLDVVLVPLGSIKINANGNVVPFKLTEMLIDLGVHELRGEQSLRHFVLPYGELKCVAAISFKLALQQKHIMAINEWSLILWIIQFYHQVLDDHWGPLQKKNQ